MTGPTQKDIQRHYEAFPFPSGGTPHLTQYWTQFIQDFLREKNIKTAGQQFLDAGCGTGDNALNFAEEFTEMIFTGIDQSSTSVNIALNKLKKRRLPNLHFKNQLILDHHPDHPYDMISCLGVLHHCEKPEENLKHLLELLKPRGCLFLDVYGYYGYLPTQSTQKAINLLEPDFSNMTLRQKAMEWIGSEFLGLTPPRDANDPRYIGLADGFLVPTAHSFRIGEILTILSRLGMPGMIWWDAPKMEQGKLLYQNFRGEKFEKILPNIWEQKLFSLPETSRYEFFELVFAPFDYFLIGQKQG